MPSSPLCGPVANRYTPNPARPFDRLSPTQTGQTGLTAPRIGFSVYAVNGTVVPNLLRTFVTCTGSRPSEVLPGCRPLGNEIDLHRFSLYHGKSRFAPARGVSDQQMKTKTLWLASLCLLPVQATAQTATGIVAKVLNARGGLDKIRAIKAQRVSGTITFGADTSGPFVVELERPLKMHMQLAVQNLTMVRVYDGKTGWANNPFAGKMNPDVMGEEDVRNISEESDFDGPLVDYKRKGNQIALVGKDQVGDKDVWRVKLTTKNGDVRYYLFDRTSFLLLKWEGKRHYEGQELPIESYFRDYRDVDGLKFAFEIDSGSSVSDISQKIKIDKIELNPPIDDAEFKRPATPAEAPAAPATPGSPSG